MSFQEEFKGILIREPTMSDAKSLMLTFNKLVEEKVDILSTKKSSLKDTKKRMNDTLKLIKERKIVKLLAVDGNRVIGNVSISLSKEKKAHIGGYGIMIDKEFRGIGLGEKLTELIIKLAKHRLKSLELLELDVFARNKAAVKLYEKMGFKKVATIPKRYKFEGKYYDGLIMHLWL